CLRSPDGASGSRFRAPEGKLRGNPGYTCPALRCGPCGLQRLRGSMSFWKSLFGGSSESAEKASAPVEYNGFTIRAAPYKSEGQYQTAGVITKQIGGTTKEHKFIRADRHASYDDAVEFSLGKARQIVDQQGDRMFG